jgi:hypothetical protein
MINSCLNDSVVVKKVHKVLAALEPMVSDDSLGDATVSVGLFLIKHHKKKIEAGQQRVWEANVFCN